MPQDLEIFMSPTATAAVGADENGAPMKNNATAAISPESTMTENYKAQLRELQERIKELEEEVSLSNCTANR